MSDTPITPEIRRDLWRFFGFPDDEACAQDVSPPGVPLAPYTGEDPTVMAALKDTPLTRAFLQWRDRVPPSVPDGRVLRMLTAISSGPALSDLGAKIETIKAIRVLTNWGLKEAKEATEGLPSTPILLGPYSKDNPYVQDMIRAGATFDYVDTPSNRQLPWGTEP